MTRPIAVLRPEPGNAATLARAAAMGLRTIRLPLFAVAPVAWSPPDPAGYDALILTSANALRHGGPGLGGLRALPVFAVGAQTADAARAVGFNVAFTGDGGIAAVLEAATAHGVSAVLHLGGRHRTAVANGPIGTVIAVYASEPCATAMLGLDRLAGAVALLHSIRAARRLAVLVPADQRGTIRLAALSRHILGAAGNGWAATIAAGMANDDALLRAAATLAD